ncbi:hypothetical protein BT96DRAFT_942561 [Gymnopus androsaceus JB14]|uniref:Cytochrome P450 n=1 Tax=Gymnopus androsaceus JB14 TaxID=1447944 RepID=A0A6A4HAI0_9AGAR|nr:hypothetical protein BT96DRAFT_942561 [Gymnopus androsaceus JB14]
MEERKKKRVRTKILGFVPNVQLLQLQCLVFTDREQNTLYTLLRMVFRWFRYRVQKRPHYCLPGQVVKVGLSTDNFRAYVGMIEDEVEEFISSDASLSTYQSNDITAWGSFESVKALSEITVLTASRTLQGSEEERQGTEEDERLYVEFIQKRRAGGSGQRGRRVGFSLLLNANAVLYQKQVKHFGVNGEPGKLRPIAYEDLRDLPALDSVIRETLRVHPPIPSIMRAVRDDVPVLPTLSFPNSKSEGTLIEPSRWNDPEGVAMMALKEYTDEGGEKIDFGFGTFAYLQLGTILSILICKMEFKLPTGVPEHNYHTTITMPKTPRDVHYRRRQFD